MAKSPDAFRTISEVAEWLGVETHVLRFWESKFSQVKPTKRAGGRRYYRPTDMELLGGIRKLLHDEGLTIKGVQKLLREEGIGHVASLSGPIDTPVEKTVEQEKVTEEHLIVPQTPIPAAPPREPEQLSLIDDMFLIPNEKETSEVIEESDPIEAVSPEPAEKIPTTAPLKPRDIGMPLITSEADMIVAPGVLSGIQHLRELTESQASEMRPLLTRLTALRDTMRAEQRAHQS